MQDHLKSLWDAAGEGNAADKKKSAHMCTDGPRKSMLAVQRRLA